MSPAEKLATWMGEPMRYGNSVAIALSLCLAAAFLPALFGSRRFADLRIGRILCHPSLFFVVLAITLFALRWPALLEPRYFNPDESLAITEALTLLRDPLFPRAMMAGDRLIQVYLLTIPGIFGFDITYGVSRFVGLVFFWTACIALYFAVRTVSGVMAARIATTAALLCFATGVTRDFLSHSTELITLPFIAFSLFLLMRASRLPVERLPLNFLLLGLTLGSVPFAKLQAVPIALVIAVLAYIQLFFRGRRDRLRRRHAALLTAGGTVTPAVVLSVYAVTGKFGEYWNSLLKNPAAHIEKGTPFLDNVRQYLEWWGEREWSYERLLLGTAAFAIVTLAVWLVRRKDRPDRPWWEFIVAGTVLAGSWYTLAAPARPFTHYVLHTLVPLCFLAGVLMARIPDARAGEDPGEDDDTDARPKRAVPWQTVLAFACLILPVLALPYDEMFRNTNRRNLIAENITGMLTAEPGPASLAILEMDKPGDTLTVWGWQTDYHVETQLPMGMLVPVSYFLIEDRPLRDFFRERNLEAFQERKPAFFLDAVAPGAFFYEDRQKQGHEMFPQLASVIARDYRFVADFQGARLYVRRNRVDEILAEQEAGTRKVILEPQKRQP